MRKGNLYKVEMYRFIHSFFMFVCMVTIFFAIIFLAVDNSETLLGDGTQMGAINSTMKVVNLMIVFLVSAAAANYVGREFKQKTIHHEIMAGYSLWKICCAKAITCGICVSIMLQLCILLFFASFSGALRMYPVVHILFMFFILCHICTCAVLYVMLCRNGALGGCLAFVRFTLLEVLILFSAELFVTPDVYNGCKALSVMSQWSAVTNTDLVISPVYRISIIGGAVVEYIVLLVIIQLSSKRIDF
ncbi:MAG: hypothetical protein NC079_05745 [Clostridium sp.]|nr:hypothetical protein [Acetatifactor muris]MCM1528016.1 hypothetical protein [Bacteroides sp.]MCM1563095.1 hypothetical protein [Clostridium sp.]